MDAKLLKEFEEMEGLSKETLIDPDMVPMEDSKEEDESSFKPTAAAALNSSDIYYEVLFHFIDNISYLPTKSIASIF